MEELVHRKYKFHFGLKLDKSSKPQEVTRAVSAKNKNITKLHECYVFTIQLITLYNHQVLQL